MRYLVLRCEDLTPPNPATVGLLEGAQMTQLLQLAQAGSVALIRPRQPRGRAPRGAVDRFQLHRGLLGISSRERELGAAQCFAAGANQPIGQGETAWCGSLMTQHDGRVTDPFAGHIPTKESHLLIEALNTQLGSETRRWQVGDASHHLFLVGEPDLGAERGSVRPPELLAGQSWRRSLPKGAIRESLRSVIEQAATVLEQHPVNRVRVDLGENPANLMWFWGAGRAGPSRSFRARTGLSGAVVSRAVPVRGLAQLLELAWTDGPASLTDSAVRRLQESVVGLARQHEFVYLHLTVEQSQPVQRLCVMERIDQLLLKPLTTALPQTGAWRLVVAADDVVRGQVLLVTIGTNLPQQGVARLRAEEFEERGPIFGEAAEAFAWLTRGPR